MYKIGITSYDNDHELWETHVGNLDGQLCYSVWGVTEQESRKLAHTFIDFLNESESILG